MKKITFIIAALLLCGCLSQPAEAGVLRFGLRVATSPVRLVVKVRQKNKAKRQCRRAARRAARNACAPAACTPAQETNGCDSGNCTLDYHCTK
jgi:hypothetical protein